MDYARSHGVPLMPPIIEGDLTKPVIKNFWTSVIYGNAYEYCSQITEIDMSKFAVLENLFRARSVDAVTLPVPAISETRPEGEEEEPYTHAERPPPNARDGFSGSEYVFGLSQCNIRNFLERKDIAVVMFYEDENHDKSIWARTQLSKASCSTKRPNHAYASVNCYRERELCLANKVTKTPRFNMYSRGFYVGSMRDVSGLTAPVLRQYVEFSPLLTQPKGDFE